MRDWRTRIGSRAARPMVETLDKGFREKIRCPITLDYENPRYQTLASMHGPLHASNYRGKCIAGKVGGPRFSIAGRAGARRPCGRTRDSHRRSGAGIGPAGGRPGSTRLSLGLRTRLIGAQSASECIGLGEFDSVDQTDARNAPWDNHLECRRSGHDKPTRGCELGGAGHVMGSLCRIDAER
jgi:hypothetical protein